MAEWVIKGSLAGPQGPAGPEGSQGPQGPQGQAGAAAGFGDPTANVVNSTGTPSVTVSSSGPDTAKVFSFTFAGIKGEQGEQGPQGPAGPEGPKGDQGPAGPAGSDATVTAGDGVTVSGGQVSVKAAEGGGISSGPDGISVVFASDEDFRAYMGIS